MKGVEWRKCPIATLNFKHCWCCYPPFFVLSCFNIEISGGFCVLAMQSQMIIKLIWGAVRGTGAHHDSVGALGPSSQAPTAASEGVSSPLWQHPAPGLDCRDSGSSGDGTGYLKTWDIFIRSLKVLAGSYQLKQLNTFNKCQCFPMRSKCDICRLCIYIMRRTIEFPLDWPCQQSLCQAVHLISFIFHVFSPALSKITISKASFPEANMHIRACSCSLDFPSPYSLSTQTPPSNPVAT